MNDVNKSMSHRVSMIILGAFLGLLAILACLLIFMWRIPVVDAKQQKH